MPSSPSPTRRQLLGALCLGGLAPRMAGAQADAPLRWPAPGRWRYAVQGRVRGVPYRASAQLHWQHDQALYQAELSMSMWLLGERRQRSTGLIGPGGLQPVHFVDVARHTRELHMDWAARRFHAATPAEPMPLPAGAQDRLSLFFQLAGLLSRAPAPPASGAQWRLPVLGRGGSEDWTFTSAGVDMLNLPVGPLTAWKLERPRGAAHDVHAELWLAPAWQLLPVRIRLSEANGDVVDQQLERGLPPP